LHNYAFNKKIVLKRRSSFCVDAGLLRIFANVLRYVVLPQSRGGACFCTRGAMQGYDGYYLILALAKTLSDWCQPGRRDTRRGSPAGAGAACTAIEVLSF